MQMFLFVSRNQYEPWSVDWMPPIKAMRYSCCFSPRRVTKTSSVCTFRFANNSRDLPLGASCEHARSEKRLIWNFRWCTQRHTPNFSKYGKEYYENRIRSLKRTNEVLQTFSTSRKSRVPSWSGSNISAIFWHFDSLGAFCTLRKADIISCKLILPSLRQKIGKCWIIQQHYCVR